MCFDIETMKVNLGYGRRPELVPYIICDYYVDSKGTEKNIESRLETPNKKSDDYHKELISTSVDNMMMDFIKQLIKCDKNIKYIYAHNLSGFDGVLLLKHLIKYPGAKVEPVLYNNKLILMAINFTCEELVDNKVINRKFVFKDSYLLLPVSLRKLSLAFKTRNAKLYFPVTNAEILIDYVGDFPEHTFWNQYSYAAPGLRS